MVPLMSDPNLIDLRDLLGHSPSSHQLTEYLSTFSTTIPTPEVKTYPDAVYFNYYSLGLSLLFVPVNGYKPRSNAPRQDLLDTHLVLDGVDIYNSALSNNPTGETGSQRSTYSPYPITPIVVAISPETKGDISRASFLNITQHMVGKEFVDLLGEPDRKGGGSGPSSGSIGIWVEWTRDGLMVEFGGEDSRGPQAWERGKDAPWKVISIFSTKSK
ncbi:hypothetical protein BJY52DRAFT_1261663 [Lactarius psammicola]|nr:hypothetical protein BJY52DRAFT_1261663 [Lactarius psammicola]